jgi:acyl dehydratase
MTGASAVELPAAARARLEAFVGQGGDRPGKRAREPVNSITIRQITDVVGDSNPIYRDDAFARGTVHGGIVAPPTSLQAWRLQGLEPARSAEWLDADGVRHLRQDPNGVRRRDDDARTVRDELNDVLVEHGFISPAATNEWFLYHRYLRPGDQLLFSSPVITDIVGPKSTSLGLAFFVTLHQTVTDDAGTPVATIRQRYLRARPGSPRPRAARPPTAAAWHDRDGERLPPLVVEVTPTFIIGGALATRDFQDVHHDRDLARERGHPDIYMNIGTSTGLVGRFVTDWAGPDAVIESLELRLGRPTYPGHELVLSGAVSATEPAGAGRRRAVVDVRGTNPLGDHIVAKVQLTMAATAS